MQLVQFQNIRQPLPNKTFWGKIMESYRTIEVFVQKLDYTAVMVRSSFDFYRFKLNIWQIIEKALDGSKMTFWYCVQLNGIPLWESDDFF